MPVAAEVVAAEVVAVPFVPVVVVVVVVVVVDCQGHGSMLLLTFERMRCAMRLASQASRYGARSRHMCASPEREPLHLKFHRTIDAAT